MRVFAVLVLLVLLFGCQSRQTLFETTDPAETGVTFANQLRETEQENILAFEYFYNGGGVAAGDLNNDGRIDLFFTGNQTGSALYLNQTERSESIRFLDVTKQANVVDSTGWRTGVTLADVNADGWLDIYVCRSGKRPDSLRRNQLYVNNGKAGLRTDRGVAIPTFTERAAQYGLADAGYSVQAAFFDYDRDGDLDCFLINHNLAGYQRKEAAVMRAERDPNAGDKLFRNEGGRFTDVSAAEGIKGNPLGFGLGVSVSDVNNDGWPDVYVTNDYVEDDYLYINQLGGSPAGPAFRDELRGRIAHTSYSAMGVDVADVNNDARPDIFTLDMLPEDNQRQKLLLWPDNWTVYQAQLQNGFWHQNMRNMLQLNTGAGGQFAEIGQLAGVSATDWSWAALLADFDLDGWKDIFVSNGLGRDLTNADFVKYSADAQQVPLLEQLKQMTSTPTRHYAFRNRGVGPTPTFENKQQEWGFGESTRANGAAYADLDNDGDLDLITNNLNETTRIYRNTSRERGLGRSVSVQLRGPVGNGFGVGATVSVQTDTTAQTQEFYPTRGFQSCSHGPLVFGLPAGATSATIRVRWPDGRQQTLRHVVKADRAHVVADYRNAGNVVAAPPTAVKPTTLPLFEETNVVNARHYVAPTNDFERQIMLPMQYSYAGPRMTTADVDRDGLPDVFLCGTPAQPGQLLRQTTNGFGPATTLPFETGPRQAGPRQAGPRQVRAAERSGRYNTDAVLADLNADGAPDLYVVNGGYGVRNPADLQDQLWLNDGRGQFRPAPLPTDTENGSCVKILDIDRDGDLDLFVGGHVRPGKFPAADVSLLLVNDGRGRFTKQPLGKLGLITDATVLDVNADGWPDVVAVGEWMPPTLLINRNGQLQPRPLSTTSAEGAASTGAATQLAGWWNRIAAADLDQDGDLDLVLGNLGLNTQMRASETEPATLVYEDFDQNGTVDFFMNYYIGGKSYPAHTRDEVGEQMPSLRRTFPSYQAFADATIEQFFDESVLKRAQRKTITELRTLALENRKGTFVARALPLPAQYAPVCAILTDDLNADGRPDLLLLGNHARLRMRIGKVSANPGVVLTNQGNWQFRYVAPEQSGLLVKGDVRDVKRVGDYVLIGRCADSLRTYRLARPTRNDKNL